MANYKTLKEILSQTSWNGADAGKLLLISYVNSKTDSKKPTVDNETLSNIVSTLPSKYLKVFTCYETVKDVIEILLPQVKAYKQQFYNGYNYTVGALKDFVASEKSYKNYLKTPLMLNSKNLENLEEISKQDFYNTKLKGFYLILKYIYDLYDSYEGYPEALLDKERAIFDKYKTISTTVDAPINTYIDYSNTDEGKQEVYLEHILDLFSKYFKIEKDRNQVLDFILKECKYNSELLGIKEIASKKKKNADDYIKIITLFDLYKQAENSFYNKSYNSLIDPEELINSLPILTIKISKYLELMFYRDKKFTVDNYQEFIDKFPELYNFAKAELIERLPLLNKPDSELFNTEVTYRELVEADLLAFNYENTTEYKLQRDYILSKEAISSKDYLIQQKAKAGIGLAITPQTKEDRELLLKYGDNYTGFNFIPKELEIDTIREYQINGIIGSLVAINSFNNMLEIYSDLLKVDLLPLKIDTESFQKDLTVFNTLIYQCYFMLLGNKSILQNKQSFIKGTFQPVNINETLPNKNKTEEYKQFLKTLAKTDLLKATSREKISPILNNSFMEGLNNE